MRGIRPIWLVTRGVGRVTVPLLSPVLLFTTCKGPEVPREAFQVSDSAGVSIIESTEPLWSAEEGWTVSPEPTVVIGQLEGDERYLLDQVAGARRLPDGRIAVLDVGSRRVRIYDSTGMHLADLGGDGDGPSEFRQPQFLDLIGDTLVVFEFFPASITWFSQEGEFIRTNEVLASGTGTIPRAMAFGYLKSRFGIATWVQSARERVRGAGRNRPPVTLLRFALDGSGTDSLLSVPGTEMTTSFPEPGSIRNRPVIFGNTAYLAASEDWIYVAPTDDFSVWAYDTEGVVRRIIRRVAPPRSVTSADIDRYVERRLHDVDPPLEERAPYERSIRAWEVAETMPATRWICADSEGNVWVEGFDEGLGQGRFSVFRSDGVWLGDVDLPDGLPETRGGLFQPWIEIGSDYVLGVWVDEFGVEQVRLYGINKGGEGRGL
jgi:hypothetical protein